VREGAKTADASQSISVQFQTGNQSSKRTILQEKPQLAGPDLSLLEVLKASTWIHSLP
jgi:hypothetical protein